MINISGYILSHWSLIFFYYPIPLLPCSKLIFTLFFRSELLVLFLFTLSSMYARVSLFFSSLNLIVLSQMFWIDTYAFSKYCLSHRSFNFFRNPIFLSFPCICFNQSFQAMITPFEPAFVFCIVTLFNWISCLLVSTGKIWCCWSIRSIFDLKASTGKNRHISPVIFHELITQSTSTYQLNEHLDLQGSLLSCPPLDICLSPD